MPDLAHENTPPLVRDPDRLASTEFDLVVVGGGIYGVWATLDAAQRGLKVALIEQNDFGSGASANSQRVVHGGLRYLQHADFKRMRESIRERSNLLRLAGHMVVPMPFLVPTYGLGMRGRPALFTAMKMNDLISSDRNRGLSESRQLPNGRLISADECLRMVPGIEQSGLTGGAIFYDAQVNNSERLTLAVVRSAVASGAQVANHMRVTGLLRDGDKVTGVQAEDRLTGESLEIRSKVTLGCAGPWTGRTGSMPAHNSDELKHKYPILRAVALVTRDLFDGMGLAVPSRKTHKDQKELISKGFRNLFVTSWCGLSLVGTFYTDYDGDPDALSITPNEIRGFIDEFNQTYPAAGLTYDDVRFTFMGLQPKAPGNSDGEPVCDKRYRLIDHARTENVKGLITVLGVKWTTARDVAEQAVNLAEGQISGGTTVCRTAKTLIQGAPEGDPIAALEQVQRTRPDWADDALIEHLFATYGTRLSPILQLAESDPALRKPVSANHLTIAAQIVYAAQNEMARTLLDVLFHRTDIGFRGYPGEDCIKWCASLLAEVLKWDKDRIQREVASIDDAYGQRGLTTTSHPL